MYVACTIDGRTAPVTSICLSEGYNEGWTATACFPAASIEPGSILAMRLGDRTNTLNLTMEPEGLTEDCYGIEATFRDQATRRLAHSRYDGSSLHCMSADTALNRICVANGITLSGSTGFGNIHYASSDEQESCALLTSLLDICGAYYNTDGETLAVTAAHNTADHTLDIAAASVAVNFEALVSKLILNKVTPCDVVTTFHDSVEFAEEVRIASANVITGPSTNSTSIWKNTNGFTISGRSGMVVGITVRSCPADYDPSFTASQDCAEPTRANYANWTSTIWATKAQATARAAYYMWVVNRDFKVARFTVPFDLSIRTGDVVSYQGNAYRVTAVTHSLSSSEASTELEASAI